MENLTLSPCVNLNPSLQTAVHVVPKLRSVPVHSRRPLFGASKVPHETREQVGPGSDHLLSV
jgi:hypothetical protein